ncbi:Gfo/Idh/MocA family protein [Paenibacillus soyae]|uniref:Gfo/Idh/MocA family oxidoreductase n=1 Tax=Paenibacillus soyae TaxID=2969249 RepID=A0A9X2MP61_9BACL|nr:Gfo/Idh/MocA family oxidoreductase [Paenibacillus soyae]MCR2804339.1 Gfo/Idh/MocA family oxidoreductase [Paenibacillus soyae]
MEAVRAAIIGCGKIAEKHVNALAELGGEAVLAALFDLDEERLERFADRCKPRFPEVQTYGSIDALLNQSDAELIVIATSSDSHAELAMKALRAGKHVLVEKPLALSMKEARDAAEEAERRGLVLAVSFQARYMPQMRAMKEAVEQGRFGSIGHGVVTMRWSRGLPYYKESPWRESWEKGGGLFMNQCIHYIDLLQWMLGPVRSVYAQAAVVGQEIGVENTGAVVLRFQSGAIGLIEATTLAYPSSLGTSIALFGEKGSAAMEGAMLNELKLWQFEDGADGAWPPPRIEGISHAPLYRDLAGAIRSGAIPLVTAADSLSALEIVLAIYRSISSGKAVELPLGHFEMSKMAWME